VLLTIHPCGKALASMGCFVCCSETLKQYLVNHARTFIFSTALPPYIAAQAQAALRIVAAADRGRGDLAALTAFLRARLRDAGFDIGNGDTQIVPIFLGENERAVRCASLLTEAGFGVRPIRPPSVPPETARLRISLTAKLSTAILARFIDALVSIREREQLLPHAIQP
jgi:8-amino-7-oxononanoate synthase